MKYYFQILTVILFIGLLLSGCRKDVNEPTDKNSILLIWSKAYPAETYNSVKTGLEWALSSIGASDFERNGIYKIGNDKFHIDPTLLGFPQLNETKLIAFHQKLKSSEEYYTNDGIDLGRYISLIIGATEHYYTLTGVPNHINEILDAYEFSDLAGFVNNSGVSRINREITFSNPSGIKQIFVAKELNDAKTLIEFETIEIMENGQLRFGIFDASGKRINASDPTNSSAGKPAKCMWCHESRIQPLLAVQDNHEGYLTYIQFRDTLDYFRNNQIHQQLTLLKGVDYVDELAHTNTEIIYISFMEPSAYRLSQEWNISIAEVERRLANLVTHTHPEFPFLGELYDRLDTENYAPFKGLPVSSSIREKSDIEVNHFD